MIGPDFKTLALPVKMTDVQKAHIRDLHKEWEPKICDATYLENSHQQSYLVLNLCRILYNLMGGRIETKKGASLWVKAEFPQWKNLIETATNWRYGIKMERQKEVIEFIKFVLEKADCLNLI